MAASGARFAGYRLRDVETFVTIELERSTELNADIIRAIIRRPLSADVQS